MKEQVYTFELAGKGTVHGRVVDATTDVATGPVVARDGEPVAGPLVSLSMSLRYGTRGMRYSGQFLTSSDDRGADALQIAISGV